MKTTLTRISLLMMLLLPCIITQAQLLQTRTDIIKDLDTDYEIGTAEDGTEYIYYGTDKWTEQSGSYVMYKFIYFAEMDDGEEICSHWRIMEPSSEANANVSYFKKNMVEIDYLKWKDYETGILYKIEVEEELCIITAWYDFDKQ